MKITFYAHASFRLEADGVSVVTDPYTPGEAVSKFDPIGEAADIVVMSSATDRFHSDPSHVGGNPIIINALEVPAPGMKVKGVQIDALPTMESLTFDFGGRDPDPNAMYVITIGGLRVLHIGDVGNPIAPENLATLHGKVDVMLALTGGHATIALDDLDAAIAAIAPRVIPMHFFSPRGILKIYPVEEFTKRYAPEDVTFVGGSVLNLSQETLPEKMHIYVLEQSR